MKRNTGAGSTSLPIAKVYLDDLEDMYNILASEGARDLKITVGDQTLESIAELDELRRITGKERVRSFSISASEPRVSIGQEHPSARISYDADSTFARGLEGRLRDKWNTCKRRIDKIEGWCTVAVVLAITWSIGASGGSILLVPFMGAGIAVGLGGIEHMLMRLGSVVVLIRRRDAKRFWQPNRDKILLILLTSAVTLLVTVAGWYLKQRVFDAPP